MSEKRKSGHNGGRKAVVIDFNEVRKYAQIGMTQEQTCNCLGVSYKAIHGGPAKRYQDFLQAYSEGRDKGIALVAAKLQKNIDAGSVDAQKFFLKARGKWRENEPVVQVNNIGVSDETKQKLQDLVSSED